MKTIFEYVDYRKYLADYYDHMKGSTKFFTYRYFSQKAGFKSPNQLQLIIQGKRNLTESALFRICGFVKLNQSEIEYFKDLVAYNQAKTLEERNFHYQKLLGNKKCENIRSLEQAQFEFFTKWYHAAVRELVAFPLFRGGEQEIAKRLWPDVTPAQVRKSIALLERFGLIKKNPDGTFSQTAGGITVSPEVHSMALVQYHQEMLEISRRALSEHPFEDLNVSSVTVGVSKQTYEAIRVELEQFRKKILVMASEEKAAERVYQLNFQLFPLTKKESRE